MIEITLNNFLQKKNIELDQIELQNRILELDEFIPDNEGIKKLVKKGEMINIGNLIKAIQNLVAAEKLEIIPEPPEENCNGFCPKYRVNRNRKIDISKFLKNLREIHETGRLDKKD